MAYEKRSALLRLRRPSGTRPARARLAWAAALVATAALGVAGCTAATAGPTTDPTTASSADTGPAVTAAVARQVFDGYVATSNQAARTNDGKLALSVVTGAQQSLVAATVSSHAYVAPAAPAASGGQSVGSGGFSFKPSLSQYTYGTPTFYLPEPADYPRFFVAAVTRALNGSNVGQGVSTWVGGAAVPLDGQVLMVFEQSSSAGPWQLGSVAQLPAGSALPRLAADSDGYIPQVPLTSAGLLAQPYSTGPLQAAVVDDGPASAAASAVAAGSLTTGLYQAARDRAHNGLEVPAGDVYQWSMEGTPYPAFALRTADGGALVFYAMYLNSTVAVPGYLDDADPIQPGRPITIPLDLLPLLPSGQHAPRVQLTAQSLLSFAAIDPPAAPSKITVIAIGGAYNYASAT